MTKKRKIPQFKTYEEEAKFWETHSITDYLDELKVTKMKVKKLPKITFAIRMDRRTISQLDSIAKEKGIGPRTLARMWLLEKLKEEYQESSTV